MVAWLAFSVWQGACVTSMRDWSTAMLRILMSQVEERMGNAVETLKALLDQCGPDSQDMAFIGKGTVGRSASMRVLRGPGQGRRGASPLQQEGQSSTANGPGRGRKDPPEGGFGPNLVHAMLDAVATIFCTLPVMDTA